MKGRKYTVKLVRPVFQAIVVEVSAEDESEAVMKAAEKAESLGSESWREEVSNDYRCHPVEVIESDDVEDPDDLLFDDRYKYLLLQADTHEAEGELLMQPWALRMNSLAFADIAKDWDADVAELYAQGVEAWVNDLEDGGQPSPERLVAKKLITRAMKRHGQ